MSESEGDASGAGTDVEDPERAIGGKGGGENGDPVLGFWTGDEDGGTDEEGDREGVEGLGACEVG